MIGFKNFLWFLCVEIIYLNLHLVAGHQNIGDRCKTQLGERGFCSLRSQCPGSVKNLNLYNIKPNNCSSSHSSPTICCSSTPARFYFAKSLPKPKSLSEQKCKEFGASFLPHYPTQPVPLCYEDASSTEDTFAPQKYPHLAFIGYDDEHESTNKRWACFGSLISEKFVLTSAHCLIHPLGDPKYVRLGNLKLNDEKLENSEEYSVETFIIHQNFKGDYNDIGLIKLNRDVIFNDFIQPACLYTQQSVDVDEGTVTAMQLIYDNEGEEPERNFLSQKVTFMSWESCNSIATPIDGESQICTHLTKTLQHCLEISGSPLQIRSSTAYCKAAIVGLVSFPRPCGSVDTPVIYTRISHFISWIENIVWN